LGPEPTTTASGVVDMDRLEDSGSLAGRRRKPRRHTGIVTNRATAGVTPGSDNQAGFGAG